MSDDNFRTLVFAGVIEGSIVAQKYLFGRALRILRGFIHLLRVLRTLGRSHRN